MAAETIVLYRATTDNTGAFVDAGSELTVSDDATADSIAPDRASDQMDSGGAVTQAEAEADEKEAEATDDLDATKVVDLKAIADSEGIDLGSATRKDDIVAAIRDQRDASAA